MPARRSDGLAPRAATPAGAGAGAVWRLAAVLTGLALPATAGAQQISLSGTMGTRQALLVIDGQPQALAVGGRAGGVRLLKVEAGGTAEVEVGGQRLRLQLGQQPVVIGSAPAGATRGDAASAATDAGRELVLPQGAGGHYLVDGWVNGRRQAFIVDTGATTVALSASMADALGLDWRTAPRTLSSTANGTIAVARITITALRLGQVQLANVAAVVVPQDMPHALLGNSALDRFTLQRTGDTLRLTRR
jgi:aspartyl protease family protein